MSQMWLRQIATWDYIFEGVREKGEQTRENLLESGQNTFIISDTIWRFDWGRQGGGFMDSKIWAEVREIPFFVPGNTYEFRKFGVTDPLPLEFQGTFIPGTESLTEPPETVQTIETIRIPGVVKVTIQPTEQRDSRSQASSLLLSATNPAEGRWYESRDPRGGEGRASPLLGIPADLPMPEGTFAQLSSILTTTGV